MIDFEGQVAVVTGAGRGLGRLYAIELARRGASVVVNDLGGTMHGEGADASVADQVVDEITSPQEGRPWPHTTPSTAPRAARRSCTPPSRASGDWTRWSAMRASSTASPFDELTPDDWRRMLRVHLDGGFYLAQPAFRVMKKQGYGRFVFISSTAGMFGQHLEAHYAAAKAGLVGLTNIIALEGAPHGILANTVLPTGFSRMVTETVGDTKALEESGFLDMIRPELVTPMVVYLASRACEFSHRNYSAIGGRYARVFIGLAAGWLADRGSEPTADDVAAHIAEISATEKFTIPETNYEEVFEITERLGVTPDSRCELSPTRRACSQIAKSRGFAISSQFRALAQSFTGTVGASEDAGDTALLVALTKHWVSQANPRRESGAVEVLWGVRT